MKEVSKTEGNAVNTIATPEQIQLWKNDHEHVYKITVEDKSAILRSPTRKELSYASKVGAQDPMKFNESILSTCWLAGDEEIKTKDSYFMGASGKIAEIISIKEATLEKL